MGSAQNSSSSLDLVPNIKPLAESKRIARQSALIGIGLGVLCVLLGVLKHGHYYFVAGALYVALGVLAYKFCSRLAFSALFLIGALTFINDVSDAIHGKDSVVIFTFILAIFFARGLWASMEYQRIKSSGGKKYI
jgi:hypothetical protein